MELKLGNGISPCFLAFSQCGDDRSSLNPFIFQRKCEHKVGMTSGYVHGDAYNDTQIILAQRFWKPPSSSQNLLSFQTFQVHCFWGCFSANSQKEQFGMSNSLE